MNVRELRRRRWLPVLSVLSVLSVLAACNTGRPNPTPGPGANAPVALVKGAVSSPVYDELKKTFRVVQYDGKQKMSDYNLLVLDGDAHSPADLKTDTLVTQAWRARQGVLVVDAAEDDKRSGLGDRLGFATRDSSGGYFARSARDATGHPSVSVVELPRETPTVKVAGRPGLENRAAAAPAKAQSATAFVKTVTDRLKGMPLRLKGKRVVPSQNNPSNPVPPALINKTYYYSFTDTVQLTGVNKNNDPVPTQTTSIQYNYEFDVYLDNQNNPQGNFQWVGVIIDATGNPTNGTGQFACNGCSAGAKSNYNADEYAWFLDQQEVAIQPFDNFTTLFSSYGNSPATINNATQVTTGVSFTIGYSDEGDNEGFTYTNEQTKTILDWKLTNQSAGNRFAWYYRSANPLDADLPYDCNEGNCPNSAWTTLGYPKQPNDISLTQLQLYTQGVWKTSQVLTDWVDFEVTGRQGLADLWCWVDYGAFGCQLSPYTNPSNSSSASRYDVPFYNVLQINMASVVPIPIQSLTFNQNPVRAGTAVTGLVTLQSPAVEDTDIQITSNSQNATVLPTVTVLQGETVGTFQVLTNANGIQAGDTSVATITAAAPGSDFQAQLQVENVNVAELTVSPNPVQAGRTATAVLTLGSPVTQDTDVALTSSSPNAVVPSKVTVKQGQTSASFQVATNFLGIPANGSTVANIAGAGAGASLAVSFSPTTVSVGAAHACALYSNGNPICWGTPQLSPPSDVSFAALSSDDEVTCGIKNDGTVACWGQNLFGEATPPAGLANVLSLSMGGFTGCAVMSGGTVVCWGQNPNVPAGLSGVTQAAVGDGHGCALKIDGTVTCWGDNSEGQLNVPAGLSGVTQVSAGDTHSCALRSNGTVACWGDNSQGQLNVPAGLSGVTWISSLSGTNCALRSNGTVVCWGDNSQGQAAPPAGLSGVAEVSAGFIFSAARKQDGTVVTWPASSPPPPDLNLNQP